MTAPKLSTDPNLLHKCKSREAASVLGMVIGGLLPFMKLEDVRDAVRWWAETDEVWEMHLKHQVSHNIDLHTLQPVKKPADDEN